jgi:predicted small metal-binding protein
MKFLRCRDAGFDCDAVIRAETEEDVLRQAAEHARTAHNLSEISEQAVVKIRALINDELPQPHNVASH